MGAAEGSHPPDVSEGVDEHMIVGGTRARLCECRKRIHVLSSLLCGFYFVEIMTTYPPECTDEERTTCSGGTITFQVSDSAVSPRVWGSQKLNHISEPLLHIFLFINNFIIFILFPIDNAHTIRIA